jgi:ABC-type ATPase with predicted acetyltransferase domain
LDQAEDGVVIRLIGEGENGLWRLKDAQNDIEVKRMDNDMIAIKASISIQEGGIVQVKQVNTRIKTVPGEIIVLAGTSGMGSNRTISLECPSN